LCEREAAKSDAAKAGATLRSVEETICARPLRAPRLF
jgi:hypothetical protein